jgi:hypothetical protein
MTEQVKPAPVELGENGSRLWSSVLAEYALDVHEEVVLLQACRCADRLDSLAVAAAQSPTVVTTKGDIAAHPALVESRQQSLTLARLVASLRLPSGDTEEDLVRPQRRGAARGTYGLRVAR